MSAAPIDRAKIGRSSRRRGADAERSVVEFLRASGWPDARRYLAGDGRQPGDIDFHPLVTLEVKDTVSSAFPTWCRQVAAAAPAGTVPVVVRRTRGVPDVGAWPIRARLGEWVDAFGHAPIEESYWYDRGDGTLRLWRAGTLAELVAAVRAVDEAPR